MRQLKLFLAAFLFTAICIGITSFRVLSVKKSFQGNAHVNGGGTTTEGGEVSTFVFNAVDNGDGVDGHLNYNFRSGNVDIKADLDCMHITGNRATLSGVVTSLNGDGPFPSWEFVGQRVSFTVEDNGQGKNADRISDLFFGSTTSCANHWITYLPIKGNIDIKE
jgi:hypothetical protein